MLNRRIIFAIGCMLLGSALVAYPYIADYVSHRQALGTIEATEEVLNAKDVRELEQQKQAAKEYNELIARNRVVVTDPFDPKSQVAPGPGYDSLLNVGDTGVMATLIIPKINLKLPIFHFTTDDVLQRGVGHMESTSLPFGGTTSHSVLAGHNGLPSMRVFDDLPKLSVGDYFVVQVLGEDHAYEIESTETVLPDETESLRMHNGEDLMTLVTCVPYGINSHRLLVHARRIDLPEEWLASKGSASVDGIAPVEQTVLFPATIIGLAASSGIVATLWLAYLQKKKHQPRGAHFAAK